MYQVEISVADVTAAGYDNSDGTSGITTIRVKHRTYTWSCRPLADPGKDCGNSAGESRCLPATFRGSGNTVWFVYRPDLTAKLTGCLLPASGTLTGHCLPGDPYRLTWSLKGNTLLRTDLYAGWPNAQWVDKPWQKIS